MTSKWEIMEIAFEMDAFNYSNLFNDYSAAVKCVDDIAAEFDITLIDLCMHASELNHYKEEACKI